MSRCFISYRHVSPDQELAQAIGSSLSSYGHEVFLDSKMTVGTRWVDQIEKELRSAEYFVVLLSEHSIQSDMVRQEVELAYQLAAERKLFILPVRVAFTGALPYDLAAYLNRLQYSLWKTGDPHEIVCGEIASAVDHQQLPRESTSSKAHQFDPAGLERLTKELAVYVGPSARVLVSRSAKSAQTWKQLYDSLAEEVPAGEERKHFLAKRSLS
jgi:hypothetical protein